VAGGLEALPQTLRLPITDESVYPTMDGLSKNGYWYHLYPGINGVPSYGASAGATTI